MDVPSLVARVLASHPVIDGHNDLLWEARVAAAYCRGNCSRWSSRAQSATSVTS